MKRRGLFVAILGVTVLGAAVVVNQAEYEGPKYSPRATASSAEGYAGAEAYYNMLRANVNTGQVEIEDILRVRRAYKAFAASQQKAVGMQWMEMGPDNVGGRTRAIEINPNNHSEMYCGGVTGGLWRSTNGANSWEYVESFEENLMVSSIAFLGNGHLYVATGSSHDTPSGTGGSGGLGHGIYRSTDGGQSFERVIGPNTFFNPSNAWAFTDEIKADPNNNDGLWVAHTQGLRYYDESDDNFSTPSGTVSGWCEDVEVSVDGQVVIASINNKGFVSNDGGQTFTDVSGNGSGELPSSGVGRAEFAISPDDNNYVYASLASTSSRMFGVFSSTDKGNTWTRIWPPGFGSNAVPELDLFNTTGNPQGNYDNCITVVPGNPEEIFVGGIQLWKTALSGQPEQVAINASFPGCFICVHSDVHEFEWHPNGDTLYIGTDGGVYKSWGNGEVFFAANRGLSATQYYGIGYGPNGKVLGGTQDNSSPYLNFEGPTPETATVLFGGDGFDSDISQMDPDIMFVTSQNGVYARSNDGGGNFGQFLDARILSTANSDGDLGDFYTNLRLYEQWDDPNSPDSTAALSEYTNTGNDPITVGDILGTSHEFSYRSAKVPEVGLSETVNIELGMIIEPDPVDANTEIGPGESVLLLDTLPDRVESLFAIGLSGNQGVWVTRRALTFTNNPEWWKVVDNVCNVNTLEWSGDGNHLFVGCSSGQLIRVSGFNAAYDSAAADVTSATRVLEQFTVSTFGAPITGIAPHPWDANKLFITLGGYGGSGKVQYTDQAVTGANVQFESRWLTGNLAGMPVYDGIIDVNNDNIWIVGTEHGVFASDDAGQTWTQENNGMNVVPTFAVRQQRWDWQNNPHGPNYIQNPGVVYLGTHGRGIFRSETLLGIEDDLAEGSADVIGGGLVVYPNPVENTATLSFKLTQRADVYISIYNAQGKLLERISKPNSMFGDNIVELDVDELPVGSYIAHLEAGGATQYGRFVVLR